MGGWTGQAKFEALTNEPPRLLQSLFLIDCRDLIKSQFVAFLCSCASQNLKLFWLAALIRNCKELVSVWAEIIDLPFLG